LNGEFEHYYSEEPKVPLKYRRIRFVLSNSRVYHFKTPSGVYSYGKIDKATIVLLENLVIHGRKILDLGCGYGVIGIILKGENPDLEIYMSDINKRAVEFSKINAKDNNVEVFIKQGNLFEPWRGMKFDQIVSNPPIVAGKKVWQALITGAREHLVDGGSLQIVAYHNKGGRRMKEFMRSVFGNVEDVVKKGGIRVYISFLR